MSETVYDFNSLTMREVATIERMSGQSLNALGNDEAPVANTLAAIAYVFKKRENAAYTFDQAQDLTLAEVSKITASVGALNASEVAEGE